VYQTLVIFWPRFFYDHPLARLFAGLGLYILVMFDFIRLYVEPTKSRQG